MKAGDVRLVLEAMKWSWMGDGDLIQDKHWAAYKRLCEELDIDTEDME